MNHRTSQPVVTLSRRVTAKLTQLSGQVMAKLTRPDQIQLTHIVGYLNFLGTSSQQSMRAFEIAGPLVRSGRPV